MNDEMKFVTAKINLKDCKRCDKILDYVQLKERAVYTKGQCSEFGVKITEISFGEINALLYCRGKECSVKF